MLQSGVDSELAFDFAKGTFIANLSPKVRWLVFLPAALSIPLLVSFANYAYYQMFGGQMNLIFTIWYGLMFGTALVMIGVWWAPKYQRGVAVLLLACVAGASLICLVNGEIFPFTSSTHVMSASMMIAALSSTMNVFRKRP